MHSNRQIISASRRTDIPAHYFPWLKKRIREGFCTVSNPFNPSFKSLVSLLPEDVSCFVFWTRNPAPLLEDNENFIGHLKENYKSYFLFTINGYPREIEPGLPPLEETIEFFIRLSNDFPVVWRFDPIVIRRDGDFLENSALFSKIAGRLRGHCKRIITSIYDPYRKAQMRISPDEPGIKTVGELSENPDFTGFMEFIKKTALENGMEIQSCCEDLVKFGIKPGACIDSGFINGLFDINLPSGKDPSQRKECLCAKSRDIGKYDTCIHGCKYCYAVKDFKKARLYYENHYRNRLYETSTSL